GNLYGGAESGGQMFDGLVFKIASVSSATQGGPLFLQTGRSKRLICRDHGRSQDAQLWREAAELSGRLGIGPSIVIQSRRDCLETHAERILESLSSASRRILERLSRHESLFAPRPERG